MSRSGVGFRMRQRERASTTTIESGEYGSDTPAASVSKEELSSVDTALKTASNQHEPLNDKGFLNAYAHISTRKNAHIKEIFGISICYDEKRWFQEAAIESAS